MLAKEKAYFSRDKSSEKFAHSERNGDLVLKPTTVNHISGKKPRDTSNIEARRKLS